MSTSDQCLAQRRTALYIDSFIPPDRLEAAFMHENIARVRGAAAYAIKAGAKIVSLGGFSSILIEGNFDQLPERQDTVFTTGNTLTVAFIVQGIKKMCALEGATSADQRCSSLEQREMWVPAAPAAWRLRESRAALAHATWSVYAGSPRS